MSKAPPFEQYTPPEPGVPMPAPRASAQELAAFEAQCAAGVAFTKYTTKSTKGSKRLLVIDLETYVVSWTKSGDKRPDGEVELYRVREFRHGTRNKDGFNDREGLNAALCASIFYGDKFVLNSISLYFDNASDLNAVEQVLAHHTATHTLWREDRMVARWLAKEWRQCDRSNVRRINQRDLGNFLVRANVRLRKKEVQEAFNVVDTQRHGTISRDAFLELYNNLMLVPQCDQLFKSYSSDMKHMTVAQFTSFLSREQDDPNANSAPYVEALMRYFADPTPAGGPPVLTLHQFNAFLLSTFNSIFSTDHEEVYQDMTHPLSHYWIASSHNTYLTGDQLRSESSVEAYTRCLRYGCRCLEIDLWTGPYGTPIVYHGHTLTSKIDFREVCISIRDHAFVASPYPLVLSLENHSSVEQQRYMASVFNEIFGGWLPRDFVAKGETELPSPDALKHKILLKNKTADFDPVLKSAGRDDQEDISEALKNSILYLEDPNDRTWTKYAFLLTSETVSYADLEEDEEEDGEGEGADQGDDDDAAAAQGAQDQHCNQNWFHGRLQGGREEARRLLTKFVSDPDAGGDGTFLVRTSDTYPGEYSLSFWKDGQANHVRVRSSTQGYYLTETKKFPTLYELVEHYRHRPLRSASFNIVLTEYVPQPLSHVNKPWFHQKCSRVEADAMLRRARKDGAFLVRQNPDNPDNFAISFRADGRTKHCRIKLEDNHYAIGSALFETLSDLVTYYQKHYLYRKMKLKLAINDKVLATMGQPVDDDDNIYESADYYQEPNPVEDTDGQEAMARALYDYQAAREDELSFLKDSVITKIEKFDGGWWKGTYDGKTGWLPANYVVAVDPAKAGNDAAPLGNLQRGSHNIGGATVERLQRRRGDHEHVFVIKTTTRPLVLAADSAEELESWMAEVRAASAAAKEITQQQQADVQKAAKKFRVAKELSDLIIYCRPTPFQSFSHSKGLAYYHMSSFAEGKAMRFAQKNARDFADYNKRLFSRIYPAGNRVNSNNYDPTPLWNAGCQLVALNYQTPERSMQLNEGKFLPNGRCGFVLKPVALRDPAISFDPMEPDEKLCMAHKVSVLIIAAKHLPKTGRGLTSPYVEYEVVGAECDSNQKHRTRTRTDNGFNPVWMEQEEFVVKLRDLAMLRFLVQDEDIFGDPNFVGQAVIPLNSVRSGYRCVPLRTASSERLELASLLVHIRVETVASNTARRSQQLKEQKKQLANNLNEEVQLKFAAHSTLSNQAASKAEQSKARKQIEASAKKIEFFSAEISKIEKEQLELRPLDRGRASRITQNSGRSTAGSSRRNRHNNSLDKDF